MCSVTLRSPKTLMLPRSKIQIENGGAMKRTSFLRLSLPLACGLLLLSVPATASESTTTHSRFAGVYLSRSHQGLNAAPSLNLSLGRDGTATVTEDAGNGAQTLFGHWVDSGSQVTVTFDALEGQPAQAPMVFQPDHDGLQAVTWDHSSWGDVEPPPMKKGFKVKQLYWLTTGP
jgi:hypothetical protein